MDVGNALVPELDEVLCCQVTTSKVVGADVVHTAVLNHAIRQYDRDVALAQPLGRAAQPGGRGHDDAIHRLLNEQLNVIADKGRIAVGIADDHRIPMLFGPHDQRLDHLGVGGVGDVG